MLTQRASKIRPTAGITTTEFVVSPSQEKSVAVPEELSLIAFKDDMQFAYLFDNFVWSSYGSPWLQMSAMGRVDSLSLAACQAFAHTVYGKHHHMRDVEVEGSIRYGQTVRMLSQALTRVGEPGTEALLVPITILLMHAVMTPFLLLFHWP